MAIVPIVGSLPKERLRDKRRKHKPSAQCCRTWAAEVQALFLPKNPQMTPEGGLCFTPQRKAKTKHTSPTWPCKKFKTL